MAQPFKGCKNVILPPYDVAPIPRGGVHVNAVFAPTSKLWNRDTRPITYGFVSGQWRGNDQQVSKVEQTVKIWEEFGDFHFKKVDPGEPADVIIAFDPSESEGSWSLIGTDCHQARSGQSTMNLGWIESYTTECSAGERAVILHQFGHVLGMLHEHQSPAGGGVKLKNVDAAFKIYEKAHGWDPQTIQKEIIDAYNQKDVSSFSVVDRLSIMHYPLPKAVTGLDYDIEYNYILSDMDKAFMAINYPRHTDHKGSWTLDWALKQVGVYQKDRDSYDHIMDCFEKAPRLKDGVTDGDGVVDPTEIRSLFAQWAKRTNLPADP